MLPAFAQSASSISPSPSLLLGLHQAFSGESLVRCIETLACANVEHGRASSPTFAVEFIEFAISILRRLGVEILDLRATASLVILGRKLVYLATTDDAALVAIMQYIESSMKPGFPEATPRMPPDLEFESVPDCSQTLFFVNFLRNITGVELRPRGIVIMAIRFRLIVSGRDDSRTAPHFPVGRFLSTEKSMLESMIVRFLDQSLYGPIAPAPIPEELLRPGADATAVLQCLSVFCPAASPALAIGDLPIGELSVNQALLAAFSRLYYPNIDFLLPPDTDDEAHLKKFFALAFGFAEVCPDCRRRLLEIIADPPGKAVSFVKKFVTADPVLRALLQGSSESSAQALLRYGESVIPELAESPLHAIVRAIVSRERFPVTNVGSLCAIELFRRCEEKESLTQPEFDALLALCHAEFVPSNRSSHPVDRDLFFAGIHSGFGSGDDFNVPTTIESLVFDPKPRRNRLIGSIVYLAAKLLPELPTCDLFLDFFTNAFSGRAFRQSFASVSRSEIRANQSRHFSAALASGRERVMELLKTRTLGDELTAFLAEFILDTGSFWIVDLSMPGNPRLFNALEARPGFVDRYLAALFEGDLANIKTRVQTALDARPDVMGPLIYRAIAQMCSSDVSRALSILRQTAKLAACGELILSSLPEMPTVAPLFLQFLRDVLAAFPRSLYTFRAAPAQAPCSPACRWDEDVPGSDRRDLSLWKFPADTPLCTRIAHGSEFISQPNWQCYTCGIVGNIGICLACALTCHRGHDLVFSGVTAFFCDCPDQTAPPCQFKSVVMAAAQPELRVIQKSSGRSAGSVFGKSSGSTSGSIKLSGKVTATASLGTKTGSFAMKAAAAPAPEVKVERQSPISLSSAYRVISQLCTAVVDERPPPLQNRLSQAMDSLVLKNLANSTEAQPVHFETCSIAMIDPSLVKLAQNLVIGNSTVFFSIKETLHVHSLESGELMSATELPAVISRIAVAQCDPRVVAVAFVSSSVAVYAIDATGKVEQCHVIQQLFEGRVSGGNIIGLTWVPSGLFHLAVTTALWTKIYDVTNDCISPVLCLQTRGAPITHSLFFNVGERQFHAVATAQNRIAVIELTAEMRGPVTMEKVLQLPMICNTLRLSYSSESDLIFISGRQCPIVVCRPTDIVDRTDTLANYGVINLGPRQIVDPVAFVAVHPSVPSVHIMRSLNQGFISMLEFTDAGAVYSSIESPVKLSSSDGNSVATFGAFVRDEKVCVVASDGCLFGLAGGKIPGPFNLEFAKQLAIVDDRPAKPEENGYDFVVPATFWSVPSPEKEGITVVDDLGQQYGTLLYHQTATFGRKKVVLSIRSAHPTKAICGIQVLFTHMKPPQIPQAIKIQNRSYVLRKREARTYCLPLKPDEVFPNATVKVELTSDSEAISAEAIEVLMIDVKGFGGPKRQPFDWTFDARSLYEFVDDETSGKCRTERSFVLVSVSAAPFRHFVAAERDAAVGLIKMMYERPELKLVCRRIILKAFGKQDAMKAVWAEAIRQVCQEGTLHNEMAPVLWRDYSLLDPEMQEQLADVVWKVIGETGVHMLVCALMP